MNRQQRKKFTQCIFISNKVYGDIYLITDITHIRFYISTNIFKLFFRGSTNKQVQLERRYPFPYKDIVPEKDQSKERQFLLHVPTSVGTCNKITHKGVDAKIVKAGKIMQNVLNRPAPLPGGKKEIVFPPLLGNCETLYFLMCTQHISTVKYIQMLNLNVVLFST